MFSNNGWCRWQFWKLFVDRNQSYEYCVVDDDENIDESMLTKSEIDDDENIDASMLTKSAKTKEAADQRPAWLSQLWFHMWGGGQDQFTPLWCMFDCHFKAHLNYILHIYIVKANVASRQYYYWMSPVGRPNLQFTMIYQLCCEHRESKVCSRAPVYQRLTVNAVQFLCNPVHSTNWSPTGAKLIDIVKLSVDTMFGQSRDNRTISNSYILIKTGDAGDM